MKIKASDLEKQWGEDLIRRGVFDPPHLKLKSDKINSSNLLLKNKKMKIETLQEEAERIERETAYETPPTEENHCTGCTEKSWDLPEGRTHQMGTIEHPNSTEEKDWQEELQIKFGNGENVDNESISGYLGDLTHFISSQKKLSYEEVVKSERERIKDLLFSCYPPDMENFSTMTEDQAYKLLKKFWNIINQ